MSQLFHTAKHFINYRLKSVDAHGIHPPFLYRLYNEVFDDTKQYYDFKDIEKERDALKKNPRVLTVNDYGAGSKKLGDKRSVKQIAQTSLQRPKYCRLLFRLVNFLQPSVQLELGTSLGITTSYMAKANKKSRVITIEAEKAILSTAQKVWQKLNITNIASINDLFDNALPAILSREVVDLAYIDGNHTQEDTLRYFAWISEKSHNHTVIVFDDIYWSKEMTDAWQQIIQDKKVTLSVDVFQLGLVFFNKQLSKQHFYLKY